MLPIRRLFQGHLILIQLVFLMSIFVHLYKSLIITSVIAGDKKFKTISFDSKFLKPLTFEKELPSTEFRRHRTIRPPKFDIDVNIPIKLPLEDEYPQEEYKKPVESNIFFQTGEIHEASGYTKTKSKKATKKRYNKPGEGDQYASSSEINSSKQQQQQQPTSMLEQGLKLLPALAKSIKFEPQMVSAQDRLAPNKRSDMIVQQPLAAKQPQPQQQISQQAMMTQESTQYHNQATKGYSSDYSQQPQDFIPGGFVNLQLSGPTGGPKMTYEDYDRERWAQQLSQTASAMPYPILNYHQLQNFYGGLGTFTNGLGNQPYVEHSLLDKLKSGLTHFTDKLHIG